MFECLGTPFYVHKRYSFVRPLGSGSYGCVALAYDSLLRVHVAIKKIRNVLSNTLLARHALREIAILHHMSLCDYSTVLLDFDARFVQSGEVYLFMPPSEANLEQVIRSRQPLSNEHLQFFAAQLLRGVRYMHAANIVHRDLKPSNLLVNKDCALRICDYGLARAWSDTSSSHALAQPCFAPHQHERPRVSRSRRPTSWPCTQKEKRVPTRVYPGGPLSSYVTTRWYRPPELVLQFPGGYGPEMDMWSVGCILAELLLGRPLFPGKNDYDLFRRMYKVLGHPEQVLDQVAPVHRGTLACWPARDPVTWTKYFDGCDPQAVDLVSKLLCWDPADRLTAAEALMHPWLEPYRSSSSSWAAPQPFAGFGAVESPAKRAEWMHGFKVLEAAIRAEWPVLISHPAPTPAATATPTAAAAAATPTEDDGDEEEGKHGDRDSDSLPLTSTSGQGESFPSPITSDHLARSPSTSATSISTLAESLLSLQPEREAHGRKKPCASQGQSHGLLVSGPGVELPPHDLWDV